jgi:hypothetical protein
MLTIVPALTLADDRQVPAAQTRADDDARPLNLTTPTLGGKQFWTDELVFHDWRIQRNAMTGHCRLLDEEDHRRAWGTFDQCRGEFEALRARANLPPLEGKVVVVLHGLGRTRSSMAGLCRFLEQDGEYTALSVSYASTRGSLDDHAAALSRVIGHLDQGVQEINFVAHSLGNLVIRRLLHAQYDDHGGAKVDPRIHRIVMLAPPNQGSRLAESLPKGMLVQWLGGASTMALADGWDDLQARLARPRCQFGIIAGGRDNEVGRNALLEGDDDFVVGVEETKLVGARDFAVLPVLHTTIMNDPVVRRYVLRFLRHGYFRSEAERRPLVEQPPGGP